VATGSQNSQNRRLSCVNRSGFKGVSWNESRKKWRAGICIEGKSIHLGRFTSAQEAARAYDAKAIELFGEFACLNFPGDRAVALATFCARHGRFQSAPQQANR